MAILLIDSVPSSASNSTIIAGSPNSSAGDVLVAMLSSEVGTASYTAPPGWVSIPLYYTPNRSHTGLYAFYKISDGNEPNTVAFTQNESKRHACVIATFSGVDLDSPIDGSLFVSGGGTGVNNFDAPSVTKSYSKGLLLRIWATNNTGFGTFNQPANTTFINTASSNASVCAVTQEHATSGATGTLNASWSNTPRAGGATIALREASPTVDPSVYKLTIDHTKVSTNLTDFPIYVNLDDITGTALTTAEANSIRIYKSDGTTELPREIVSSSEMHFKGDLSSTVDTVFVIDIDGVRADYATNATYGAENVWASYGVVMHNNESSGAPVNSTGKVVPTYKGTLPRAVAGKIGSAQHFNGTNDYIELADDSDLDGSSQTVSFWVNHDTIDSALQAYYTRRENTAGVMIFYYGTYTQTINWDTAGSSKRWNTEYIPPIGTSVYLHFTFDGSVKRLYVNGTLYSSSSPDPHSLINAAVPGIVGGGSYELDGVLDEFRLISSAKTPAWIATEYANQHDPSTFYTIEEDGPGGSPYKRFTGTEWVNLTMNVIK